jgi:hypothetical protein
MPHTDTTVETSHEGRSRLIGAAKKAAKRVLARFHLKLERLNAWSDDDRRYIPFKHTMAAARAAGLAVGDYIEAQYDVPGAARNTLIRMQDLGVFVKPAERVCEIGPGSGRYLRETLKMCGPESYEVYETATDWAKWLVREYGVTLRPTDGRSLAYTPSDSMALVHAHKVLPVVSFLSACRYVREMARVVRTGGKVVFDVMTEDCIDAEVLQRWLDSGTGFSHYPGIMPRSFVTALLARLGLRCDGEFVESMKPGFTHYFVATKCECGDDTGTR